MTRPCIYCGNEVTSTNPDVGYCKFCFYDGTHFNHVFADLIADLPTTMDGSGWWHTGGGCFALQIFLGDGYLLATADGGAEPPDTEEGPWWLGRYTDAEDDEGTIVAEHLDRAQLLAAIEEAAG